MVKIPFPALIWYAYFWCRFIFNRTFEGSSHPNVRGKVNILIHFLFVLSVHTFALKNPSTLHLRYEYGSSQAEQHCKLYIWSAIWTVQLAILSRPVHTLHSAWMFRTTIGYVNMHFALIRCTVICIISTFYIYTAWSLIVTSTHTLFGLAWSTPWLYLQIFVVHTLCLDQFSCCTLIFESRLCTTVHSKLPVWSLILYILQNRLTVTISSP